MDRICGYPSVTHKGCSGDEPIQGSSKDPIAKERCMSKGQDTQKANKKKALKTLKEKRSAKRDK